MNAIVKVTAVIAVLISGCAGPSRNNPGDWTLWREGVVPTSNIHAMVDCLNDRFSTAHWAASGVNTRQQRRAGSFRIETYSEFITVVARMFLTMDEPRCLKAKLA